MWSLIFVILVWGISPNLHPTGVATSHVDAFMSKKMCEAAGKKLADTVNGAYVEVDYTCTEEIK